MNLEHGARVFFLSVLFSTSVSMGQNIAQAQATEPQGGGFQPAGEYFFNDGVDRVPGSGRDPIEARIATTEGSKDSTLLESRGTAATTAGAWQEGFTMASGCSWTVSAMVPGPDGKLYFGGAPIVCGGVSGTLYTYDPATGAFDALGDFAVDNGSTPTLTDIAVEGDNLYLVGNFSSVDGITANRVARYDFGTETWSSLGSGDENGVTGTGFAASIAADADNVYLGFQSGNTSGVGTLDVNAIARWNITAQSWSAMSGGLDLPDPNDPSRNNASVRDMVMVGDTLYVGGRFATAGGAAIEALATFSPGSGWSQPGTGIEGNVAALESDGTSVYAAGSITDPEAADPATADLVTVVEFDGTAWNTLASSLDSIGFGGSAPHSLLLADGFLYFGGWFSGVDGVAARSVARFDLTTRVWEPLGTGADNGVTGSIMGLNFSRAVDSLAKLGDDIYAGGFLTGAGADTVNNIARWNPGSGAWAAIGPSAGKGINAQDVWALATDGSEVLTAGPLTQSGQEPTRWLGRFDIAGGAWSVFGNDSTRDMFGTTSRIAFAGGEIYANQSFGLTDDIADSVSTIDPVNGIVRWDAAAQDWATMGPTNSVGLSRDVGPASASLLVGSDDALFVSGTFDMAGDTPASNIARWDVAGQTWSALGDGLPGAALSMAISPDGQLYAGGAFPAATGGLEGIQVWDPVTGSWSQFGQSLSNGDGSAALIQALAFNSDGDLIVAGSFDTAGGLAVNNIARWDGSAWHALGGGVTNQNGESADVDELAIAEDGDLFVIGNFDEAGGQAAERLARWNGSGWFAVGPSLAESLIEGDIVHDLAVIGPDLFIAGKFSSVGGVISANFAHFVRDQGGSVLEVEVTSEDAGIIIGGSTQASSKQKSGVQGQTQSLVYTIDVRNVGMNNAFDAGFSTSFSPAPVAIDWTCAPLPESRARCPQTAGSGAPDLLLDLPFDSGLRFELVVDLAVDAVFQDLTAQASAEQQFGNPDASRTVKTKIVPASVEAVFKSGFEP